MPATIGQLLGEEFPWASEDERRNLLGPVPGGEMCDEAGHSVGWDDPVTPGGFYFFHRPVPEERRIPFDIHIVFEDEDLLVVDKPHFLPSTPNGRFVRECVVTRLRVELGLDDLVAIHRLDRITAGLLILSKRRETRGTYQRLFQDRLVSKTYRALAATPDGHDPRHSGLGRDVPLEVRSRLVKPRGGRQVLEVEGEVNAISRIRFLGFLTLTSAEVGEYELAPVTGKTHQLRVHMASLGLPILGDPVYPHDLEPDPYDFSSPLQLLAARIEFIDPQDRRPRRFDTGLSLAGHLRDAPSPR